MNNLSRVRSYIGFAVKGRKIIYGANLISDYKKKIYLLIGCESASDNAKKQALAIAENRNLPLITTVGVTLEELANKANCKLAGVTDANLAKAIMENMEQIFSIEKVRREV